MKFTFKNVDHLSLSFDEKKILLLLKELFDEKFYIFGEFALSCFASPFLQKLCRRINCAVMLPENEIKEILSLSSFYEEFLINEYKNQKITQYTIQFADDTSFNKPFLCLYVVLEDDFSLVYENPFSPLQIYFLPNFTTFGLTINCELALNKKEANIYCYSHEEKETLKSLTVRLYNMFNIIINVKVIDGEIYNNDIIKTF